MFSADEMNYRFHRFTQMVKRILLILVIGLTGPVPVSSDILPPAKDGNLTIKEELRQNVHNASGLNKAYTPPVSRTQTPAPEGKVPFAIVSFGRHGSCYLGKPSDYDAPYNVLAGADSIGQLTPLGKNVLDRLSLIRRDAYNHWGELSEVGVRQQQEIAWRMVERFPEILDPYPCLS